MEGGRRLDPETVHERAAGRLVRLERLRLAAGPIERQHQLATKALAEWIFEDERLELADQLAFTPEGEIRLDPQLGGGEMQLLQSPDRRLCEGVVRELGQRRAAPQRECLAERLRSLRRLCRGCLGHQLLEPVEVKCVWTEP